MMTMTSMTTTHLLLGLFGLIAIPLALAFGVVAGLAIAAFQLWATRRAAERAADKQSATQLLLGMPLRVGVPALAFVVLMKLSVWSLLGALLAFQFGRGLLVPLFDRTSDRSKRDKPRQDDET